MKVLQVIDTFGVGGAEKVDIDLSNLLYMSGLQVAALTLLGPGKLATQLNPEIRIRSLNRRHRFDLEAARTFIQMAREVDLVHVHMRHNYRYCRFFALIFNLKTPIVLHDHCGLFQIQEPWKFRYFLKPVWYIGVSQTLVAQANLAWKIAPEHTLLLSNIVFPKPFETIASKNGIVLVSNIKPAKNQGFAIQLLTKIDSNLTLYGAIQDPVYFQELQSSIIELGLSHKIRFVEDCTEIQEVLPAFRLGLHTSTAESGPLVLIEYLAQGLPFLAFDTGEVASILRPYFPFYFINNLDPDQWVERIAMLLQIPPDPKKMQQVFEQHFGHKLYTEKCLSFYQRVVGC